MRRQAESLANLGSWELDLKTGEMTWSLQLYRTLGYDPVETKSTFGDLPGSSSWISMTKCCTIRPQPDVIVTRSSR